MVPSEKEITAQEFEKRLVALCRGTNSGLPRKHRDRHIIFRSIVQTLDAKVMYSEQSLNEGLKAWASAVGMGIAVDHVTLRRYLVDAGYLCRDRQGTNYRVQIGGTGEVRFEPSVGSVDSAAVIHSARRQAAIRKRDRSVQTPQN